ncbi:MAG: type II toxin-antitoxin system VapC family toxin [Methylococcales bacterium]|jgi:predicted nucleic acid-binding protein|nr:type II toxin-antitoxin system VapC family toxin [Methylococcales bacterium]
MNITIDTSALIAVIANEPKKSRIVQLTVDASLLAPFSVHWEIGNAFSAMLKRNRVTPIQAQSCIALYQQIRLRLLMSIYLKPLILLNSCRFMRMTLT